MNKKLLLITLITTASAFGAQAHPCPQLPLGLELKLAELKLKNIDLKIAKGPKINYKDLILPALGMGTGLLGIVQASSGVINNKKIVDIHGASLLISSLIFLVSYMNFNTIDSKEIGYLEEKKAAQQDVVRFLRAQLLAAKKA